MIRQSLIDERVSALHHRTLQSPGDGEGDMSKSISRRFPAPVTSRIVIKKNSSLITTEDETTTATINSSPPTTSSPTLTVDPRSRVELLERNLRYVQQQHEITLIDLHREISRLQQENRDLHFHMIDLRPQSSSKNKQNKTEIVPNVHQLADLTQKEPNLDKRLQEVQRLHFEQQINELRTKLIETEQKNEYLMRRIDELNKKSSEVEAPQTSPSVVPVLLPDPNTSPDANIKASHDYNDTKLNQSEQTQMTDNDYQQLLKIAQEKQRQQLQEITRLRAVLREILKAERLSSTSKILVRDCLASTNFSENINTTTTTTTTPIDSLYNTGHHHQQGSMTSISTAGKPYSFRQPTGQNRSLDQRFVLPPITQGANPLQSQDPTNATGLVHSSLSQTNASTQQQQPSLKLGETPVAKRERRTQELQRTRLTRNLYH